MLSRPWIAYERRFMHELATWDEPRRPGNQLGPGVLFNQDVQDVIVGLKKQVFSVTYAWKEYIV